MRTHLNIDILVAAEGEKDNRGPVYRAPKLHEAGSAVMMVHGAGGTSGLDCRYYYTFPNMPYGYGC